MNAPDESTIEQIKAKMSPRELHQVEMDDAGEVFYFLMTRPLKAEWTKYMSEMKASPKDDLGKLQDVIERAALAQIRWPDREQVVSIFDQNPGMSQNFGAELAKLARTEVEVRSKKL